MVLVASIAAQPAAQEQGRQAPASVRDLLAAGLFEQGETAARDQLDRLRASEGDETPAVAAAADELLRALILNGRSADERTIALSRRTLRAKEALLGPHHQDIAASLFNLGDVLSDAAEFDEAIAVTRRAVTLREERSGPDSLDVAEALDHFGTALSTARRHDDALEALERSLRLKEKNLAASDAAIAPTLEEIGLVWQRKGVYERSGVALRRAVAIRAASDARHPAYVRTLNLFAQQLWFEGDVVESRLASERAVELAQRTLRPDHPLVAQALRYLAATLSDLGDMSGSLEMKARALAIAERNFGPTHHATAEYLHSLGWAESQNGAYATARPLLQKALAIYEKKYGPRHEYVATVLTVLALTDASLGDYANARREQSRAVAIHEHIAGPRHPFVAIALADLATVYREQGAPVQALRLLERALAIREMALGPAHRDVARTLAQLASTMMDIGQTARAEAAATRAIGIWEHLDTPDAPEYATALALYAGLLARRGSDGAARGYYERAMAIRARAFGGANPSYAEAQAGLALALARLGGYDDALRNAIGAETTGRDHLRTMLRSLPERQSLNYAAARPRGLDLILSLTGTTPEAVASGLDGLIRSRALVLDEMAARRSAQRITHADPLWATFTSAEQRIANLVVRGPGQLTPAQYNAVLDDARRENEIAEQALAERSAEFRAERARAQLGLGEVTSSLPADSALVSFVRYNRSVFAESTTSSSDAVARSASRTVPSYLAFILRNQDAPAVVALGSARTIDRLVSQWRSELAAEALAGAPSAAAGSSEASRASGAALRRLIWDPIASRLGAVRHVFIVPDGALGLVPFVALPVGQHSYVLERAAIIHYLSAERDIVAQTIDDSAVGKGLLALGGPAFDDATLFGSPSKRRSSAPTATASSAALRAGASPCDSVQSISFAPLDGTLQEVREISRLWSTPAMASGEESRVLVGRDASEPALKREAHRYRVLHLATHGFFLGDSCAPAAPGTRAVGGLASNAPARRTENPLLLSGLALAGANHRQSAGSDEDDGILTAEEVASLDLGGVEWAVLSACETGVGQIKTGEGVFGLRRAFQQAGAHTVIMSLWSVDDEAARGWMRALYEGRFQKHLSTADAVHAANLAMLRRRRASAQSTNPFYWAAFVAVGNWN